MPGSPLVAEQVRGRRAGTVGTLVQIGLAVGVALGFLTVGIARGTAELEVIGIYGRLMNNGTTVYLPLSTFQDLLARSDANTFWVRSPDQAEPAIDRLAATAEDDLAAAGYPGRTEIHYVATQTGRSAALRVGRGPESGVSWVTTP